MNDVKEIEVVNGVAPNQKTTLSDKVNNKVLGAVALGTTYAMTAAPAHAESALTAVGASMTGEIDGAKSIVISLFTAAAVVLALFVGWKYLKRGGNSA